MEKNKSDLQYTLLYVDDEESNLKVFERAFRFDFKILTAKSGAEALEILRREEVHLLLTDQRMPGMTGLELLQEVQKHSENIVRMILSAYSESEILLEAIHSGKVYDYILKPWRKESLEQSLKQAVAFYQSQFENSALMQRKLKAEEAALEEVLGNQIIGVQGSLKDLAKQILKVGPTDSSVLIRGETGTGKELVARALHENSKRRSGPFVKINASAFSEGVLESELFGHEKGAFTGAIAQKKGRFELAKGGTLFLDEVGDLPESIQIKLLRVLQEKEFERVGGTQTLKMDVRLLAATHQPLEQLIEQGKFRTDLFYRLNVIPLELPPLRERKEDIAILADHLLKSFNQQLGKRVKFSPDCFKALQQHPWPGNVRELKNLVERLVVLADKEDWICANDLEVYLNALPRAQATQLSEKIREKIELEEKKKYRELLKATRGNLSEAAKAEGIPRTTLASRLKKLGLI